MFGVKFVRKELNGCYRSTQRMVDFYSNFENIKSNIYSKSSNRDDRGGIFHIIVVLMFDLPKEFACIIQEKTK